MGLEIINIIKKEKGMTSKQLSEKSKVPLGTLNKILNGQTKNPAYETIFALAKALECSVDMFCDKDKKDTQINTPILSQQETTLLENYNKLDKEDKNKVVDYTKLLSTQDKYKITDTTDEISATKVIELNSKEDEPKTLQDLNPTILAAHDDDLTEEEKNEADRRILEVLKNMKK